MNKFCRLLSELRPSHDEIRNQLVDREIELRASSNSEKEKLKKQLEISENENKRLRNERNVLNIAEKYGQFCMAIFLTEKSQSLKHEVSVLSNGSGMNSLNSTCNEELVSMLKDRKVFAFAHITLFYTWTVHDERPVRTKRDNIT